MSDPIQTQESPEPNVAQRAINYVVLWKVAIGKLLIRCLLTAIAFYLAAMANMHWSDLDGDSRFKLWLGLLAVMLPLVSTFLDKSEANLASGKLFPPDIGETGNTGQWTRQQTRTDTATTTQTAPPPAPLLAAVLPSPAAPLATAPKGP
jgi:hypothetical protein